MYTVYKITNLLNGKYYIGVHKTMNPNDSYMGSGKAIKQAIEIHGKQNFKKEIILITENKNTAYSLEKDLTVEFNDRNNYNMKLGGVGGFSKENSKKGYIAANFSKELLSKNGKKAVSKFTKEQLSENGRKGGIKGGKKGVKRAPLSEEHKNKIRQTLLSKNKDR
jgi:hypothetical protein